MKAFFFDMDGVLFDSLPNHAAAWEEVMPQFGLPFTARDCYLNEGRTSRTTIRNAMLQYQHREPTPWELETIYRLKCEGFDRRGGAQPMTGAKAVLDFLSAHHKDIWIVTGSAQHSLLDKLNSAFPGIFTLDHMITAEDVHYGKPDPEPYLKAWERCGLPKHDCCVIENAPLGVRSGKAAGLTVYAVNTGILTREDLYVERADQVFDDMAQLLTFLQSTFL